MKRSLGIFLLLAAGFARLPSHAAVMLPAGSAPVWALPGNALIWQPAEFSFHGVPASEAQAAPNPFLDYRLNVTFQGPSGQVYLVPGFYDGDGLGGGTGDVWRARFSPDEVGVWNFQVSFRQGPDVNVDLSPSAGNPVPPLDGETGSFTVERPMSEAPGFYAWGLLEYVDDYYMKFREGPYFIKGGTDSPENLFGYAGFDNLTDYGGIPTGMPDGLHRYPTHVADWQPGDQYFVSNTTGYDSRGLIGALNYLSSVHVNAVYFLPMNLGGDGQETYPFLSGGTTHYDKTHYDVSKLGQWNQVVMHAVSKGILLQFVLAETESANANWFDGGTLGSERKLFYREMIARFGHALAIKWNLCEESNYSTANHLAFAGYIQALDPYDHPITFHTHLLPEGGSGDYPPYADVLGDARFSASSIQYWPNDTSQIAEKWRTLTAAAGRKWVIDLDEQAPADTGLSSTNAEDLRKRGLYDAYFSGAQIEWYGGYNTNPDPGGDVNMENFRSREAMWRFMWYARSFMQLYLPFWEMVPADPLVSGESLAYGGAEVFAKAGAVYAVYLPVANPTGSINLTGASGFFGKAWYNPRTGLFQGPGSTVSAGGIVPLGPPPADPAEDWVVLLKKL